MYIYRTGAPYEASHTSDLKMQISGRIQSAPDDVWTPVDFLDLGSREAVDKALQRLALAAQIRRLDPAAYMTSRAVTSSPGRCLSLIIAV